jgi:methylase of polypeptide subunit release factors
MMPCYPSIEWEHLSKRYKSSWYSEAGLPVPEKILLIDDTITVKQAIEFARQKIGLLWNGDYQNGRNLLQAISRRLEKPPRIGSQKKLTSPPEIFAEHRRQQGQKAQILGQILISLNQDFVIELRRAQDVSLACKEVLGDIQEPLVMPFKQLLAMISAHEWRKKKVLIPAIQERIIPHFGVFSPIRGEYLELVKKTKFPPKLNLAFDIGTGTGVLSVLLAQRGVSRIIATDIDPRAIACAKDNINALKLQKTIEVVQTHLFPQARADLVVCNPPWLPAQPTSSIENAIYDPDSEFLKEFLKQLPLHLEQQGQAWLILSDLAEHLGLRKRETLLEWIDVAGLNVVEQILTKANHSKIYKRDDPLYFARSQELTSLWVLTVKDSC